MMGSEPPVNDIEAPLRPRSEEDVLSLVALATLLLRYRRLLLVSAAAFMVVAVALVLLRPREFVADARFMPDIAKSGAPSTASALAAQFGVSLGSSSGGESLAFYTALVESRSILLEAIHNDYHAEAANGDSITGNLIRIFEIEGSTPEETLNRAIRELSDRIQVTADYESNLITLRVRAQSADLAVKINRRLLELVNRFNVEQRQSRAAAERVFVENRMDEAAEALSAAQGRLQEFLAQNRRFQESPELTFEARRLEEDVSTRLQLFRSLSQSYEQARIEEVRNIPVITVLEHPEGAAQAVQRRLVRRAVLGLMLGMVIGIAIVLVRQYAARQRAVDPAGYQALQAELASTRESLPWYRRRMRWLRYGVGSASD